MVIKEEFKGSKHVEANAKTFKSSFANGRVENDCWKSQLFILFCQRTCESCYIKWRMYQYEWGNSALLMRKNCISIDCQFISRTIWQKRLLGKAKLLLQSRSLWWHAVQVKPFQIAIGVGVSESPRVHRAMGNNTSVNGARMSLRGLPRQRRQDLRRSPLLPPLRPAVGWLACCWGWTSGLDEPAAEPAHPS